MSKRLFIYLIIGIAFIAIVGAVLTKFGVFGNFTDNAGSVNDGSGSNPNPTPSLVAIPGAPQGSTFQIGTLHGSVTINNFYQKPLILDQEFLILKNTDQYQINYDTETSHFFIHFSSVPDASLRAEAEKSLLSILGVGNQDACKLGISEDWPGNEAYRPTAQDLSFCSTL